LIDMSISDSDQGADSGHVKTRRDNTRNRTKKIFFLKQPASQMRR
jgi:hypothetical protein